MPLPHSLLLTENIKLDGITIKIKYKVNAYWFHFVSIFEVTSYKMIQLPVFYLYLFLHQQISFFLHFSSLYSTLCEKRFPSQTFTFLWRFTPTLQLHNSQNLLNMTKVFFNLQYGCPHPPFGHPGGDSLTNLMLITDFSLFCLESH